LKLHINFAGCPLTTKNSTAIEKLEMESSVQEITERVRTTGTWVDPLRREVAKTIVGQEGLVDRLLVALLGGGHVLLEGVPGLAKTLSLKTLASATSAGFQRLQFTPDMLPADIVGTLIYSPQSGGFETKRGPIFANLILADEINRAPAKVQSALLESMQERQVTIGEQTFPLPDPFLVLATQNPVEQEGTYPLPEAQVDRFMLKVVVDYPTRAEERVILDRMAHSGELPEIQPVLDPDHIVIARQVCDSIYIDDGVKDYMVDLVRATRSPGDFGIPLEGLVQMGASPRATIFLAMAARAHAFLDGRGYVTPQDVKSVGLDVLRHRVVPTYEAEAEDLSSEDLVGRIFDSIAVP
jgi:MoxR-like ATPase